MTPFKINHLSHIWTPAECTKHAYSMFTCLKNYLLNPQHPALITTVTWLFCASWKVASLFEVADGNVRKDNAFHKSIAHVCISVQLFESNFNLATGFKKPCQSSQAASSTYRCEGLK